jgi:hypothetical protein
MNRPEVALPAPLGPDPEQGEQLRQVRHQKSDAATGQRARDRG